ncbi:MAG: outer membrane beta-barrel protein, partial [Nitrospirota bacterium]|nr:outer membrane beta-barrel protein [Nitrospirota bacterium]
MLSKQTQTTQPDPSTLRAGSFLLNPEVTISELYDDNIFATRKDEQDDFITIISPSLQIQSDWTQHRLNVLSGANIARYVNDDLQNYEDYWVEADGRYDLSGRANVFGGARFSHLHIPRTSPNEVFGTKPTIYREIGSHVGIFNRWDKVSIRLGGTYERLDFDNVSSSTGEINNDDRDRNSYGVGSRLGYVLSPRYEAFVQGAYDNRTYDAARCCASGGMLYDRDSQGFNLATGLNLTLTDTLTAEVLGGYLKQDYADSNLKDVSAVDFGGLLRWRATPATTVRGFLDRSVEETIVTGASSYVNTQVGARISHRMKPRLTVNVNLGYSHVDFQGISRLDHVMEGGAGFKYRVHPNFFLTADYQLLHRDSNVRTVDYFQNLVQVGVGGELPASFSTIAANPMETEGNNSPEEAWSGLYIGGQAGFGGITSELSGPRGSGGTLDADFGDHGFTEGAFGGYGVTYRQWYVGAEIEGEASQAEWDHTRSSG